MKFYSKKDGSHAFIDYWTPSPQPDGLFEVGEACFGAFFTAQSNGKTGLIIKKLADYAEKNGVFALELLSNGVPFWSSEYAQNGGYLPARPNAAHTWNGTEWVADAALEAEIKAQELAALKADLCATIDQRAIEIGDAQIKHSVYLSSEYQRNASDAKSWRDNGYAGDPPFSVKTGAESHGITAKEEADLILSESAMAEGFIETLRTWRMNAKGVNGIQGATTVEAAQAVFDAAIVDLEKAIGRGK
jgi:hypothetical protein